MWVLSFFVKKALVSTSNSSMTVAATILTAVASVQLTEPLRQKKISRSYSKVLKYLFRTFASHEAICSTDIAILRYTRPVRTTMMLYADNLNSDSCKAANVHNEPPLGAIIIKDFDALICHSLKSIGPQTRGSISPILLSRRSPF